MKPAGGAGRSGARASSALLAAAAVLLIAGTALHPSHEDPNDPLRAFAEYADDDGWLATHLLQLAGVLAMIAGLLLVMRRLADGPGRTWAALATACGTASLAAAAALQAVDGIALKAMVDAWAAARPDAKQSLFDAALAVRQVEIGVAAMSACLLGLTVLLACAALHAAGGTARWLPWFGALGGAGLVAAGLVIASSGFSATAMAVNLPASVVTLFWILLLALVEYRRAA